MIIATGLSYAPFKIGNKVIPGVFNTINEIPKASKQQVAVVVGNQEAEVKLALAVAKKYKYVYLCSNAMELAVSKATLKKLAEASNLLTIQNASPTKATFEENTLTSIALDNYSKITCNAVFAITAYTPETEFISEKFISKENGYLQTDGNAQSFLVPKCFAIGNCACKSTKKIQAAMVEAVLNDFNGG